MVRNRGGSDSVLLQRNRVAGDSGHAQNGKAALRDQFVRPFIAGFPGNRHIVNNMIFGKDVVGVEWSFEADHRGPFAGRAATGIAVKLPGCGVYEFDPANRHDITQTDFITPASGAAGPSDIVVRFTGLFKQRGIDDYSH